MPLHVLLTVDCGAEALRTERAFVGLHAHVRRHVPGEAAVGRERRVADAAAECLHSCDNRNRATPDVSAWAPRAAKAKMFGELWN